MDLSYSELVCLKSHIHAFSYLMKFNRKSIIYIGKIQLSGRVLASYSANSVKLVNEFNAIEDKAEADFKYAIEGIKLIKRLLYGRLNIAENSVFLGAYYKNIKGGLAQ